jgi:ribose transport system permease protein
MSVEPQTEITPTAAPVDPPGPSSAERAGDLANRYGLLVLFVGVMILFSVLKPGTFPTVENAQAIASTQAVIALLALAATLPLVVGQFDVSIGFQLGLSQTLCAGLMIKNGWAPLPAAAAGVASCLLIGFGNGALVTRLRLNSFIATLGVGTVVLGLTQLYGNDETISGALPASFTGLGQNQVLELPLPFVYVAVTALVLWLALEYTSWGRECHATGGNPRAALLAGVRTDRVTMQCFVSAGLLSGLAGVLSVTILGAAAPTVGLGALLPAYAAAFLGATAFRPGRFNSAGTMLAIYLLATGVTGLQSLGAKFYVEQLFYGGALLVALAASAVVERRRSTGSA